MACRLEHICGSHAGDQPIEAGCGLVCALCWFIFRDQPFLERMIIVNFSLDRSIDIDR